MANLLQMQSELQLQVMAKLLGTDVTLLLNQAQREEVESGWPWGFLLTNFVLYPAAPQSGGSISVVQGSDQVVGVGTSFSLPALAQSWIHIGFSQTPIPIASVQSGLGLTLTQPWMGPNISGTSYNIFTPVYSAPGFLEIYNIRQIIDLNKVSRESINLKDPSRLASGGSPATEWADAGWDAAGNPQFELWESPASVVPYIIEGKLAAATMVNPTDLPQIPSAVLQASCMMKCCYALHLSNGDNRYKIMGDKYAELYLASLENAKQADARRQQQIKARQPSYQIGLDILATHDNDGNY